MALIDPWAVSDTSAIQIEIDIQIETQPSRIKSRHINIDQAPFNSCRVR